MVNEAREQEPARQGEEVTPPLTDEQLRAELYFHMKPLEGITENAHEWLVGTWTLSKSHTTWRAGYAHPLLPGATLSTFDFDVDGMRGVGLLFESAGEPPWTMIGWVPPSQADDAAEWAAFLNGEIAKRLANEPAGTNTTFDPHDGAAAQEFEYQREMQRGAGIKPYKMPRK